MILNIFDPKTTSSVLERLEKLTPSSKPVWGKMNAPQMLAHLNVSYEMAYENKHPKPNFILKLILKWFVKNKVVGEQMYPKGSPTAPQFIIKDNKDFELEKKRLIEYIEKTEKLGANYFEGKESLSFGKLTSKEWSNMFYKHIDHHFQQFGI